jgi:hypothetical protein
MNRRWAIGIVVALVVVLGGVGLALALGNDNDSDSASSATTTTRAAALSPSPSTGSTSVTVGIVCPTPEDAAQSVVAGWVAGDQPAAGRCASVAVITDLFSKSDGSQANWTFQGCQGDPGDPECAFSYEGGGAFFAMNGSEADGWKAVSVRYVAD